MSQSARVELVLYVSPASQACARAERVMRTLLSRYHPGDIDFRVCDLDADPEAAERDRITFTPTLVKRAPLPSVWLLGDLTKVDVLTDLLRMSGVEPVGAPPSSGDSSQKVATGQPLE